MFFDCPLIKPFWVYVLTLLQNLLNATMPLNPIHYLLGLPFLCITKTARRLITFILLAAKRVVPCCWLSTSPQTRSQLLSTLANICKMQHLIELNDDLMPRCNKTCEVWDDWLLPWSGSSRILGIYCLC